jgi:hypothetical protein
MRDWLQILVILAALLLTLAGPAQAAPLRKLVKKQHTVNLGETLVNISVYENEGRAVTFIAPHFNEQTGARMAKEFIQREGGRLIEIESYDAQGNPARRIEFALNSKTYTVDPNRVFTENGRVCAGLTTEVSAAAANFADAILKLALAPDTRSLRAGERFLVAVHNNADVDAKAEAARAGDLTAVAFIKAHATNSDFHGAFEAQADGVFLSNQEDDADNFVLVSTPILIGHFAERGFNVVAQKSPARLDSRLCGVDDGSLSIYAARQNIPYINLEADAANGAFRQRQMLAAVYDLLPPNKAAKNDIVAALR